MAKKQSGPRVLFLDIETAPIEAYVWGLYDQNVGLNQIKNDWFILAWAAKWQGEERVYYADKRKTWRTRKDKALITPLWRLMDKADIIVTQNGVKFDAKKLNARFVINKMGPPAGYRHRDTKKIASKYFGFSSNSLAFMARILDLPIGKGEHSEFPGMELWIECLKGNQAAWREMEKYNKRDIAVLELIYDRLVAWDSSVNYNVYHDREDFVCQCGHPAFKREGFHYTDAGKFQRYRCKQCGTLYRSAKNLLDTIKRQSLMRGIR